MGYMEFSIWLQNAINSLQEPTKSIVILLLCICVPLLLGVAVWFANKQENNI